MNTIKTEWDLGLFYTGLKDPQIEKDFKKTITLFKSFEKKYSTKTTSFKNENFLYQALFDFEKIFPLYKVPKPINYLEYVVDVQSENKEAYALLNKLQGDFALESHRLTFFELTLGKLPKDVQKKLLNSKKLSRFSYLLYRIFEIGKYDLSLAEEKIYELTRLSSDKLWRQGLEKNLNKKELIFQGKNIPLSEAHALTRTLPVLERYALHEAVMEKNFEASDFAEAEINAIFSDKKIFDDLRGFKEPYDKTLLLYQNDPKTVLSLVEAVTSRFSISHRFYKLKAKLLKLPRLRYADRNISIKQNKVEIPFENGLQILGDAFDQISPRYKTILDSFMREGQIDVFPKKGKGGGAYCSSGPEAPTMVLLNYTPQFESVMTFAHEMGHAIHSELSKSQPILYQRYTTSVAEVASTLFERFAFDYVFETLSEEEKIVALHDRLQDDIQTIFRQIACFNFELDLHNAIREKGSQSKEEIAVLMNKHMKAYLGPLFDFKDKDGYFFVSWPHIRNFFYVYSYAYGQLISKALYENYKKDKSYLEKIEIFLSAGGSKSPQDIFKSIGIDTSNPDFFIKGLESIEKDIAKLEKLTEKY